MDPHAMLPPVSWHNLLTLWTLPVGWLVVVVALGAAYAVGLGVGRRRGAPGVHPARVLSWYAALVLLFVGIASGIGTYAEVLFWVHMVLHLLLVMVVPAFLVLGHPISVLRGALSDHGRDRLDAVLASPPVRVLLHPATGIAAYTLVIVGTHLTNFMDSMMGSSGLTSLERVLYLVGGYLLMNALVGFEPIKGTLSMGARLFLSVVAMTPDTVVGIVLLQSDRDLFPSMAAMRPAGSLSALDDLHTGGALMWAVGDGLMMLLSVGLIVALIADPRRDRILGSYLDGVRRNTMADTLARGGDDETTLGDDVDDDEAALAAYNKMLGRLGDGGPRRR